MRAYLDSSVIISMLVSDEHQQKAAQLWGSFEDRVSSSLLEIECLVVLQRVAMQLNKRFAHKWIKNATAQFNSFLAEINLKSIDESIISLIRSDRRFSSCRTLDAIHVATAYQFQNVSDLPITLCSFDGPMRRVASDVGLAANA